MAKINMVDKKVGMTLEDIIKYQLITYCYINRIVLSDADLNCLTLIGLNKKVEVSEFCNACCDPENRDRDSNITHRKTIFKTPQTVRNCLAKLANHNIIKKDGAGKSKIVELNDDLKIQIDGNILLNYKIYHIGTQES